MMTAEIATYRGAIQERGGRVKYPVHGHVAGLDRCANGKRDEANASPMLLVRCAPGYAFCVLAWVRTHHEDGVEHSQP